MRGQRAPLLGLLLSDGAAAGLRCAQPWISLQGQAACEAANALPAAAPAAARQCLDLKNMQVISQVLAQSVAMDFYSR